MNTLLVLVLIVCAAAVAGVVYFVVIARKSDPANNAPAQPAPVNVPVQPTPVPAPEPVNPRPYEPVPGPNLPPNPSITDILFRPSQEIGGILDGRVANTPPSTEIPVTPWPSFVAKPGRYRVNIVPGALYFTVTEGIKAVTITPTASDPAGQNGVYHAIAYPGSSTGINPGADWPPAVGSNMAYVNDLPYQATVIATMANGPHQASQVWVDFTA